MYSTHIHTISFSSLFGCGGDSAEDVGMDSQAGAPIGQNTYWKKEKIESKRKGSDIGHSKKLSLFCFHPPSKPVAIKTIYSCLSGLHFSLPHHPHLALLCLSSHSSSVLICQFTTFVCVRASPDFADVWTPREILHHRTCTIAARSLASSRLVYINHHHHLHHYHHSIYSSSSVRKIRRFWLCTRSTLRDDMKKEKKNI